MYARVIVAQLCPLQPQHEGVLPPSVLVELKAWPGFEDVLVLLDQERNGVKLIFLWTDKAALEAYEASPAYQWHREAMERSFSGPAVYEAYEAPFHLNKVSGESI
jgi:heme-degrading monooxygenase HmoA